MNTKYHGEIEKLNFPELTFEDGLPGFQMEKTFILLPLEGDSPFTVLQSTSEPDIAFITVNPFDFYPQYEIKLSEAIISKLDIKNEKEVAVLSILTVQNPFENTTANLQAPIVINHQSKKGKQIILNNSSYTTKHPIMAVKGER